MIYKLFLIFLSLSICFIAAAQKPQTTISKKSRSPAQNKEPDMQETSKWLTEKFQALKPDSVALWICNDDTAYHNKYIHPTSFELKNQYLIIKLRESSLFRSHLYKHEEFDVVEFEFNVDLTTIDTIMIGKSPRPCLFYQNFVQLTTKNDLKSIVFQCRSIVGASRCSGEKSKTNYVDFPLPKNEEADIQKRFVTALKHYVQLCKKRYPPKKEIF
jgi:hypothetical protein